MLSNWNSRIHPSPLGPSARSIGPRKSACLQVMKRAKSTLSGIRVTTRVNSRGASGAPGSSSRNARHDALASSGERAAGDLGDVAAREREPPVRSRRDPLGVVEVVARGKFLEGRRDRPTVITRRGRAPVPRRSGLTDYAPTRVDTTAS